MRRRVVVVSAVVEQKLEINVYAAAFHAVLLLVI